MSPAEKILRPKNFRRASSVGEFSYENSPRAARDG
jgi:hypothetical protein